MLAQYYTIIKAKVWHITVHKKLSCYNVKSAASYTFAAKNTISTEPDNYPNTMSYYIKHKGITGQNEVQLVQKKPQWNKSCALKNVAATHKLTVT